jgi:hypothetical protein
MPENLPENVVQASADSAGPVEAPSTRTVVIEVVPYDAKVLLAGVAQPGPPFVISVPAGKRIALEVAKKGYAPRRVVVDGSESKMTIGLLHSRGPRVEAPPPRAPEADPGESAKDSRLRVRSGL